MTKYLDLHSLDFISFVDLPWFRKIVRDLSILPYYVSYMEDEEIADYYADDPKIQSIFLGHRFKSLIKYSMPYLSILDRPDEEMGEIIEYITENWMQRDQLLEKARDRYQPEWYCLMHMCHYLNGTLTFPLMQHLYPGTKWWFIDTGIHAFVSNDDGSGLKENDTFETTSRLDEPMIVDFYWSNIGQPFKGINLGEGVVLDSLDQINAYLGETYP